METTHFLADSSLGRFFRKIYRIARNVAVAFYTDECSEKASALTFYSLLSVVPVLAVAFGIAKGFGFEENLQQELSQKFIEQKEVVDKLISFAQSMLQNTQSNIIAGVGLAVLLWSVLVLFGNIESSFNAIWKIKRHRSFTRKLSDYSALILLCPIFIAISGSFSVYIYSQLTHLSESSGVWKNMSPLFLTGFRLFPFAFSWLFFTALYYVMPNTHVPLKYAVIAGILAGTAYQLLQWTYIQFQVGLSSYGAIYGSFAALPLFLIWLNTSWLTTLLGAEIAFHTQQDAIVHGSRPSHQNFTVSNGRVLSLRIMEEAMTAYFNGKKAPDIETLSNHIGALSDTVDQYVGMLLKKGLLVKVYVENHATVGYQPGRDPTSISVQSVCEAVDSAKVDACEMSEHATVKQFEECLKALDSEASSSSVNRQLRSFFSPES